MAKKWHVCPYLGIRFLTIFGSMRLKIFVLTQETSIYRLVVRNRSNVAYFSFRIFGSLLAGKWTWPPCAPLMAWGFQTKPKRWPTGWNFSANHYLEIMFWNFQGRTTTTLKCFRDKICKSKHAERKAVIDKNIVIDINAVIETCYHWHKCFHWQICCFWQKFCYLQKYWHSQKYCQWKKCCHWNLSSPTFFIQSFRNLI